MSIATPAGIEGASPDAVVRQCLVFDTWPFLDSLPWEARCKLCEAPEIEPGENDPAYTDRLRALGIVFGPATKAAVVRWVEKHLRQKHGRRGITAAYEVDSGAERWVF